jgi:hypothetical protein
MDRLWGGDKEKKEDDKDKKDEKSLEKSAEDTRTEEEKRADEERLKASNKAKQDAMETRTTPPPGVRKFKLIVQSMVCTNNDDKEPQDVYFKFIIGRTRKAIADK